MSIQLIQRYYKDIDDLKQYGGSDIEAVISQRFGQLIDSYCEKRQLKLIPQLDLKTKEGRLIRPDGTIKNALRIEYGYWESKANVNLDEEIRLKFNAGYPKTNILFEDSKTAVLFQDGEEVNRVKIHNENELHKILDQFISFEHPEVRNFNEAVDHFKKDIPKVVEALQGMIEKQEHENTNFQQARNVFFGLCKQSINPSITIDNINEMLIQHILTEEIFMSVFSDNQFIRENIIASELYKVEDTFFTGSTKRQTLDLIKNYYEMIKHAASAIADHHEKQTFLKVIYENFYKAYNPKGADKLGIVYTPNEIVKFQIESVDYLLHKHFGKGLANENVEILDPATGTGTYICDILEYIPKQYLEYKYKNEIHANEVAILPYYIANLNIEYTFRQKMGYYEEFKNICFVDTLDNVAALGYEGKMGNIYGFSNENAERIKQQNERKISVIIGNPPYNANQQNENDNNKNREYEEVDKRIKDTYIKKSKAQKAKTYDMYTRFFRWASDRVREGGIICFITNSSLINAKTFDGFRKSITDEFDYAYIIDLGGNIRELSGKDGIWMNEEHTIFGKSAAVGVCITYLVKIKGNEKHDCKINYIHPCNIRALRKEKFEWLQSNKFQDIPFKLITPDKNNNWINLPDNDWESLIKLIDKATKTKKGTDETIFKLFTLGTTSNRDKWVYDLDLANLKNKVAFFIETYNNDINKISDKINISNLSTILSSQIKHTRDTKRNLLKKIKYKFQKQEVRECLYRVFTKHHIYYSKDLNEMRYQTPLVFPKKESQNFLIAVNTSSRPFNVVASKYLVDLHFNGDSQCLPFYRYDKSDNRIENITDWGLEKFKTQYPQITDLSKEKIFHYVYGVLHNPTYRKKYELNLKREFPRIPFYKDFEKWAAWGQELMELHINYETVEPYQLTVKNEEFRTKGKKEVAISEDFIPKVKLKADKISCEIIIDELTTIKGIPKEAWEYKLGIRSAMEWILDQYKEKEPSEPIIAEKFNTYKFADYKDHVIDLIKRVITVSVKTMQIVKQMETEESHSL